MRKILGLLAFLLSLSLPAAGQQQPIRVNCGGPSYTDSKNQVWQADTGFIGGTSDTISTKITGTPDPLLYEDFRSNPTSYSFFVPNGQYQVNLHFAEASRQAEAIGRRKFNVSIQGATVFANLDIFAAVGANAALIKTAIATVTDGMITIGFTHVAGWGPKINAIEITGTTPAPQLKLNFLYPDGTPVTGTLNYKLSSSLLNFSGNAPLTNGQATCYLFTTPSALGLAGQFKADLSLTDSAGHTLWQFTVTLDPGNVSFGAVQSSALNVVVQKM